MTKIKEVVQHLETFAPSAYQESYDNSGLLTGDKNQKITGVLVSLDVTENVVNEAIKKGCSLIVAHHPIIFKGLKSLTGKNYVERTIISAIKNDIAIYAIHTNLDNVLGGVNSKIAEHLGLVNTRILHPKQNTLVKLTTFAPLEIKEKVLEALYSAGAGNIGNYSHCSYSVEGEGTFMPNEKANPSVGSKNTVEIVSESRIEVILPQHKQYSVINALQSAHSYEEVAYYLTPLQNTNQHVGSGVIGELSQPMEALAFLKMVKKKMVAGCVRHTDLIKTEIKKVAVCGGSGSFLLGSAKGAQADIFITSDFKYHEFFDAENDIIIADIGHYESEQYTKDLIIEILSKKFSNFALNLSETVTNPISYL